MSLLLGEGIFIGSGTGGGSSFFVGWYANEAALVAAYPTGVDGNYAIVGDTDTVWIWDSDTTAWLDSGDAPPALGVKDSGVIVDAATNELNFTGSVSATQTAAGKVDIDVPVLAASESAVAGEFLTSYDNTTGAFTKGEVDYNDLTKTTKEVTTDDDIITTDYIVNCNHSAPITLTVLDTVTAITDKELVIKDVAGICASTPVTIESENTATFDGADQFIINGNYDTIRLITDGTNWYSI